MTAKAAKRNPETSARLRIDFTNVPRDGEELVDEAEPIEEAKPIDADDDMDDDRPVDLLGGFELPTLPPNLLPKVIEDYAQPQADMMGGDAGALAVSMIVSAAAAIPGWVRLKPKRYDDGWYEHATLWAMLVGGPSSMKTPLLNVAKAPLESVQTKWNEEHRDAVKKWEEEFAEAAKNGSRHTGEKPSCEYTLIKGTSTVEGVCRLLCGSNRGLLRFDDELKAFFGSLGQYSGAAKAEGAFYLMAYNSGSFDGHRAGWDFYIERLQIGVLGGVQPDVIRDQMKDRTEDGLTQRMIPIVLGPAGEGHDNKPLPAGVRDRYAKAIEQLTGIKPGTANGFVDLAFDDGAQAIYAERSKRHKELVRGIDMIDPRAAFHFGKYDGMFARLCIVWHCLENIDKRSMPLTVRASVAERVANFMEMYLKPHALHMYCEVIGAHKDHALTTLAKWMIARPDIIEITARDLARSSALEKVNDREMLSVFQQLEAFRWVELKPSKQSGKLPHCIVNPRIHELFAEKAAEEKRRLAERIAARDRALAAIGVNSKKRNR